MSRAVDSARAILAAHSPVLLRLLDGRRHDRRDRDGGGRGDRGEAQCPVADPHEADPGSERRAPGSRGQRLAREAGSAARLRARRPPASLGGRDERCLPGVRCASRRQSQTRPQAVRPASTGLQPQRPSDTRAEVRELEGPRAVRGVRAVERRRDEDNGTRPSRSGRGESRSGGRHAVAREGERHELGGEGACGDRVGEAQERGADGVHHPPARCPGRPRARRGHWTRAAGDPEGRAGLGPARHRAAPAWRHGLRTRSAARRRRSSGSRTRTASPRTPGPAAPTGSSFRTAWCSTSTRPR